MAAPRGEFTSRLRIFDGCIRLGGWSGKHLGVSDERGL